MANFHKKQEAKAFRKGLSSVKIAKRLDAFIAFTGESKDSISMKLSYYKWVTQSGIRVGCDCGCGGVDVDSKILHEGAIIAKALYR